MQHPSHQKCFLTSATAVSLQPGVSDVTLDAIFRQQNSKAPGVAEAPAAPDPAGDSAVYVVVFDPVRCTRRRGTRRHREEVSYYEEDHESAEDIQPRPTIRHRRLSNGRKTMDKSPVATTSAAKCAMAPGTDCRYFDICVPASLPVGVPTLPDAEVNVVLPSSFLVCLSTISGLRHVSHGPSQHGNVHRLLKAAHILSTHRTHMFLTFENVYCLGQLEWLHASFLKFWNTGSLRSRRHRSRYGFLMNT